MKLLIRNHKLYKKIIGTCLSATLLMSSAAYAAVLVPPIPMDDGVTTGTSVGSEPGGEIKSAEPPNAGNGSLSEIGPGGTGGSSGTPVDTGNPSDTGNPVDTGTPAGTGADSSGSGSASEQPVIQAESAVLMDAATGKVLYGKNEHTQYYPASITKLMTSLLVLENCRLDDVVTFSETATTNLESGSVSLSITEGDTLTVEQSLYGLLLKSANEIANGLAEHVSGSVSAFAVKMNQRAKELGCLNTNFVNPNGLNNTEHKTTPYDMALIARAVLQNDTFRRIDTTLSYQFPATKKAGVRTINMGHKMMYPSDARYYEGIIGGKTGYTSKAGNTLVTGVERDGIRLIAVVMKSSSTHYEDTKALLDYGFANYQALTGDSQWRQDANGWRYIKADGTAAKNEWLTIDGSDYWFDANEYMATGWRQFNNGAWYYFRSGGVMAKNYWAQTNGAWFYLGSDGVMLTNTTTPDGYWVNEAGIWEQAE